MQLRHCPQRRRKTAQFCSFGWGMVARKVWLSLAPKVTLKAVTVNGTEQAAAKDTKTPVCEELLCSDLPA